MDNILKRKIQFLIDYFMMCAVKCTGGNTKCLGRKKGIWSEGRQYGQDA